MVHQRPERSFLPSVPILLLLLLFLVAPPPAAAAPPLQTERPGAAEDQPALAVLISSRDAEMAEHVLRLLSMDLEIFGYRVADPLGSEEASGTIRLKVTSAMEKTSWRGSLDDKARLETRRLTLKGSFKSDQARVRLLEEDVAGCFLTEKESMNGGLFQRTRKAADGVWVETDTSLIMRMIRRLEIEIFSALGTGQSTRALLALYWEFPDLLGPRILDTVRKNRKAIIPVLESLYASAEGSERAAAAAILARYAD
jgi:hypothetical protein